MSLINYFPDGYEPTIVQSTTITKIQQAFKKNRFVVLCAPTGSGKSFYASTLSNSSKEPTDEYIAGIESYEAFKVDQYGEFMLESSYNQTPAHGGFSLTITKSLQDQYQELFNCVALKGKANYKSTLDNRMDVEMESAVIPKKILDDHRLKGKCLYHNARNDILINKFGTLNYSMFMSLPKHLRKRQFIICDEASELENELVSKYSCNIQYDALDRLNIKHEKLTTDNPNNVLIWLQNILEQLTSDKQYLQKHFQKKSSVSSRDISRYKLINLLHTKIHTCISHWYDCEYIIEKNYTQLNLTPLKVDKLASNIFEGTEQILLMSATIVDHKEFTKSLGIDNYEYIEIESDFDPAKSPIICSKKYPLNKKNLSTYIPKITKLINQILSKHKKEKGVIHTHTHEITDIVNKHIDCVHNIYAREPGKSNEDIIQEHAEDEGPSVLISPSLTHGIDLIDDLARFQIIVKLPYVSLHDKRSMKLFQTSPEWYENKMLNSLIQATGRATRSSTDWSVTYILDGNICRVIPKCASKLPNYFLQRFI